jgi:DNA-3-methyladenine glycosylase II
LEYIAHLSKDKKLRKILLEQEPLKLTKRKNIHLYLCGSIMSQQLSTRVAETINKRFLKLYGKKKPSPREVLDTPAEILRSIGLSNAKTSYVHNVARFALEEGLDYHQLKNLENEQAIAYLTKIKGVGNWTAEMILMFSLGREDVFAVDDLGIQQSMKKLYRLDDGDKKQFKADLLVISKKWSPYRTYACMHLWRWKDGGLGK